MSENLILIFNVYSSMRLVSWNCCQRFREKFKVLKSTFDADIYVIPECEDPGDTPDDDYRAFATNYIWTGDYPIKGLGIFAKPEIKIQENDWDDGDHHHFISCRVNDSFDLIAVWTMKPYVREIYDYLQINRDKLLPTTILVGDFNSHVCFNAKNKGKSHTDMVNLLSDVGLQSAYHYQYHHEHGKEEQPTFYLNRNLKKPFHFDYCFLDTARLKNIKIGRKEYWGGLGNSLGSDHLPLIVDFD